MSGYLLSVIGIVLISAVLTALCPNGKTSATIKGVTRLACVLAITAPILRFFKTGTWKNLENTSSDFAQTVIEVDVDFIQYYSEIRIKENERALERKLLQEYGISAVVTFAWSLEEQEEKGYAFQQVHIQKITVETTETVGEEQRKELQANMSEEYGCEVWIE